MEIINQRESYDCVIAAIAMWTKQSYEEIMRVCIDIRDGNPLKEAVSSKEEKAILNYFDIHPVQLKHAYGGTEGILSLPSINIPMAAHALYYKDWNIYDPNEGRKNKKHYPRNLKTWPGCYTVTCDAKDPYIQEMIEYEIYTLNEILKKAREK